MNRSIERPDRIHVMMEKISSDDRNIVKIECEFPKVPIQSTNRIVTAVHCRKLNHRSCGRFHWRNTQNGAGLRGNRVLSFTWRPSCGRPLSCDFSTKALVSDFSTTLLFGDFSSETIVGDVLSKLLLGDFFKPLGNVSSKLFIDDLLGGDICGGHLLSEQQVKNLRARNPSITKVALRQRSRISGGRSGAFENYKGGFQFRNLDWARTTTGNRG